MKKIVLLIYLFVHCILSFSQYDSIYVTVDTNYATIWHTQVERNCGALYVMDIQITDYNILLVERDTGASMDCMCYFDLSVTIGLLHSGDYTVDIYSKDLGALDSTYWGSVVFTINNKIFREDSLEISQCQSDCYDIVPINNTGNSSGLYLKCYPNPGTNMINIKLSGTKEATIQITNLSGQVIFSRQLSTDNSQIDISKFPKGIYFISITSDDFLKTEKLIKL